MAGVDLAICIHGRYLDDGCPGCGTAAPPPESRFDRQGFVLKADPSVPLPEGKNAMLMRKFDTGATRNTDEDKLDFEGFYSPIVMRRFAAYMHKNRVQADGALRASDNWQKGIPKDAYMKSAFRHFFDWWENHRTVPAPGLPELEEALCALLFNAQGYLFEILREKHK